ncbi:MAG: hypothetical protein O2800_03685 [Planctomycetota bacterium]|nr:hypothetical protein [Planctomycetota bacterium]
MNRQIALLVTLVSGVLMVLSGFLIPTQSWAEDVAEWFNVLASIAFVLGAANLAKIHLSKISSRDEGWGFSAVTLIAFVATLAIGFLKIGVAPLETAPLVSMSGEKDGEGSAFWWLYTFVMSPITATMFSLLAFYVASAAFRAFRAKNVEATLLLVAAFIVLLGRTFAGVVLTGWIPDSLSFLRLENLSTIIFEVFASAGNRAIIIGIALGVAATSLKIILGIDRSYMGSGD